jgi:YD repeat-containing protein
MRSGRILHCIVLAVLLLVPQIYAADHTPPIHPILNVVFIEARQNSEAPQAGIVKKDAWDLAVKPAATAISYLSTQESYVRSDKAAKTGDASLFAFSVQAPSLTDAAVSASLGNELVAIASATNRPSFIVISLPDAGVFYLSYHSGVRGKSANTLLRLSFLLSNDSGYLQPTSLMQHRGLPPRLLRLTSPGQPFMLSGQDVDDFVDALSLCEAWFAFGVRAKITLNAPAGTALAALASFDRAKLDPSDRNTVRLVAALRQTDGVGQVTLLTSIVNQAGRDPMWGPSFNAAIGRDLARISSDPRVAQIDFISIARQIIKTEGGNTGPIWSNESFFGMLRDWEVGAIHIRVPGKDPWIEFDIKPKPKPPQNPTPPDSAANQPTRSNPTANPNSDSLDPDSPEGQEIIRRWRSELEYLASIGQWDSARARLLRKALGELGLLDDDVPVAMKDDFNGNRTLVNILPLPGMQGGAYGPAPFPQNPPGPGGQPGFPNSGEVPPLISSVDRNYLGGVMLAPNVEVVLDKMGIASANTQRAEAALKGSNTPGVAVEDNGDIVVRQPKSDRLFQVSAGYFRYAENDLAIGDRSRRLLRLNRWHVSAPEFVEALGGSAGSGWTFVPYRLVLVPLTEAGRPSLKVTLLEFEDGSLREYALPRITGVLPAQADYIPKLSGLQPLLSTADGKYLLDLVQGSRARFDATGRLESLESQGTGKATYAYDHDRLTRISSGTVWFELMYDDAGRLTGAKGSDGQRVTYKPDRDGRIGSAVLGEQRETVYGYTGKGLLSRIDGQGNMIAANEYDALGRMTSHRESTGEWRFKYDDTIGSIDTSDPTGQSVACYYDTDQHLLAYGRGHPPLQVILLNYDTSGRVIQMAEAQRSDVDVKGQRPKFRVTKMLVDCVSNSAEEKRKG